MKIINYLTTKRSTTNIFYYYHDLIYSTLPQKSKQPRANKVLQREEEKPVYETIIPIVISLEVWHTNMEICIQSNVKQSNIIKKPTEDWRSRKTPLLWNITVIPQDAPVKRLKWKPSKPNSQVMQITHHAGSLTDKPG